MCMYLHTGCFGFEGGIVGDYIRKEPSYTSQSLITAPVDLPYSGPDETGADQKRPGADPGRLDGETTAGGICTNPFRGNTDD